MLYPGKHLDRTHQQASQWSTNRLLWYQKNTRICCTKILLANASLWCRQLREGMQCMPSLKKVQHKLYGDLQSLPVPTHCWKDLSMDFVTGLLILTDWKENSYDSILVIVNRLIKIVYYKPVKVTINAPGLVEVIINIVVRYHGLPDSIATNRESFFTSKIWLLLCYFLGIKRKLSITFHPQTDGQTERQNSIIEAYLQAFVNFKQNDWARLLSIAEFAFHNAKNVSTGHTLFELNCKYHPHISYKKDLDLYSKSKIAEKLSSEL